MGLYHQTSQYEDLYRDCLTFYRKFLTHYGSGKCREIIGIRLKKGKNIRRLLYKGVVCLGIVYKSIGWINDIVNQAEKGKQKKIPKINSQNIPISRNLHCAKAVMEHLESQSNLDLNRFAKTLSGFSGGIACQGNICGALMGGVLALGLVYGHNPQTNQLTKPNLLKSGWAIMRSGHLAFRDEKLHPSFAASNRASMLYRHFVSRFTSADCKSIRLACNLAENGGSCQQIITYVSNLTSCLIKD